MDAFKKYKKTNGVPQRIIYTHSSYDDVDFLYPHIRSIWFVFFIHFIYPYKIYRIFNLSEADRMCVEFKKLVKEKVRH